MTRHHIVSYRDGRQDVCGGATVIRARQPLVILTVLEEDAIGAASLAEHLAKLATRVKKAFMASDDPQAIVWACRSPDDLGRDGLVPPGDILPLHLEWQGAAYASPDLRARRSVPVATFWHSQLGPSVLLCAFPDFAQARRQALPA